MKTFVRRKSRRNSEHGMTLIEVMLAGFILVIGFMALFGLIITAIASNNRNKIDSTGTMLAQSVVENINSVLARTNVSGLTSCSGTDCLYTTTDCDGNTWTINTGVGGAALSGTQIDFSESAPPSQYYMNYAVCNSAGKTVYDVRWNVQVASNSATPPQVYGYLVTVGVRKQNQNPSGGRDFAFPINLRTYVAN